MAAPASPPSEKHCRGCGRCRPLNDFRRVHAGRDWPRHSRCHECRNRADRRRRSQQRPRITKRHLTQLARARSIERIDAVLTAMLDACGGLDAFVQTFDELICTANPAGRLRCHRAIANLSAASNNLRAAEKQERVAASAAAARERERIGIGVEVLDELSDREFEQSAAEFLRVNGWKVAPSNRNRP